MRWPDGRINRDREVAGDDDESHSEKINRELIELINELRVALVGVQVLFAFLLAVPFAQGFADVTSFQKTLFFGVLCSTAIASALLVAPSAYHRINFRSKDKEQMLRTSNGLMIGGLAFVGLSIIGAVVLIADYLYSSTMTVVCSGGRSGPVRRPVVRPAGAAEGPGADPDGVLRTAEQFDIGATGFEPATSCSQSRRATKLRHAPWPRESSSG